MGFAKKPSFENAFFIYPEDEGKLADLLYVHASVNLLNSFITEICSKDFGSSKERVKKILNVLEEMITYLEPEKDDLIGEDDNFLHAPYSMEANDKINGRLHKVKEKQKLMRELRVVESCVQILYLPFITKVNDFAKIKQEDPITSICTLTYKLLGKIIEGNDINEMYASQWIGLYLKHILETTEENQIGADVFTTTLVDQNIKILEQSFKPDTIIKFIT